MALKADVREALVIAVRENKYDSHIWTPQEVADDLRDFAEIEGLEEVSDEKLLRLIVEWLKDGTTHA
jgi:hypothetical protein